MIDPSTQFARLLTVRQSFQFKLFRSKRLRHLDRTIDVASEIWNHSVALKNRYYKLYGKGLPKLKLQTHLAKLRNIAGQRAVQKSGLILRIYLRILAAFRA